MSVGGSGNVITTAVNNSGQIYAAGAFTTFHGLEKNRIVRLNANGTIDATFTCSLNS